MITKYEISLLITSNVILSETYIIAATVPCVSVLLIHIYFYKYCNDVCFLAMNVRWNGCVTCDVMLQMYFTNLLNTDSKSSRSALFAGQDSMIPIHPLPSHFEFLFFKY